MLIVIAGAGNVGRAIARDLIKNGHNVTVIDDDPAAIASAKKSGAETVLVTRVNLMYLMKQIFLKLKLSLLQLVMTRLI